MNPDSVNLYYLKDISAGDNQMILEMIDIFNKEVPEYLKRMNEYLHSGDWVSLSKLAHKAKASASIMGMQNLAGELHSLEVLAKEQKDPGLYQPLVGKIEKQFNSAIQELKLISGTLKI